MSEKTPNPEHRDSQLAAPVDLQIVGAGLGGLITANLAVDAGLTVRLIEKQRSAGGRAGSSVHEGYTLNQGPHALYLSGELRSVLKRLGIEPTGAPPSLAGAIGTIGSTTDLLPQGPGTMFKSSLLPGRGKRHVMTLMAKLQRVKSAPLASTSVEQWIAGLTDVPEARAMINGLTNLSTYNAAADLASADAAVEQLKMALGDGVIYVDGGWGSIVTALENRLVAAEASGQLTRVVAAATGVVINEADAAGSPADRAEVAGLPSGHQAVLTPEATYPAANTVLAAGSPAVCDRLLGGAGLEAAAGPAVQAAVMDVGVEGEPPVGIHLGLDSGLYYSTHSSAKGLTPPGLSLISIARYLRPGDDRPADETKELLLDHAERAGVRRQDIVMSRYLHRLTVTAGMPLAQRGGLAGRPTPRLADHPGVYLVGDWVGGRGLLADATAASADDAAAAVIADSARRAPAMVAP